MKIENIEALKVAIPTSVKYAEAGGALIEAILEASVGEISVFTTKSEPTINTKIRAARRPLSPSTTTAVKTTNSEETASKRSPDETK